MKKTLIAALIAGIPAVAAADVTIYGAIKGGVESIDTAGQRATNIEDVGSRIGFKGAEDLGNGLKAIWQVETGVAIDNSANSGNWASRQSFVGVTSDFGTLRLGNISNFGDSDLGNVDPYEYNSDALGLGIYTRGNTRVKNAVRYDSPEYAGFKAAFLYGTEEDKSINTNFNPVDPTTIKNKDRETYNLGLGYNYGPMFAKYAYTYRTKYNAPVDAPAEKGTQHQLEVGYEANNLFVAAGYRLSKGDYDQTFANSFVDLSDLNAATLNTKLGKFESSEYALTATYSIGNFMPKVSFVQGTDVKVDGSKLSDSGYQQFVVGTDYALSKRTVLSAQYGHIKLDDNLAKAFGDDKIDAFGAYVVHKF
ncbi:porin [Crenobacter intestini]|uniref:Porin n=1 Tax=Crenobacter intestini TaxID=2563443 RepID=A0A4T0UJH9_9NEIS|nr:porin [Crenobacter intestini]TIC78744.1 porin [Crenobacter intestini]